MKKQMQNQILISTRLSRLNLRNFSQNLFRVLIPALLWGGAIYTRPWVIHPSCLATSQLSCTQESVLGIDQLSLGMENQKADDYSFETQDFAGIFALAAPVSWTVFQAITGVLSPTSALF